MSDISTWSTTADNNNSASPDGFPEGMAPSGVNNSAREVMAALAVLLGQEPINVKNFSATNAVGDGTTDDATALQAAINQAESDGRPIYLPGGNYLIGTGLTIDSDRVVIVGHGATITADTGVSTMITVGSNGRTDFNGFHGIKFDGDSNADYAVKDVGTRFLNMTRCQGFSLNEGLFYQAPTSTGGYSEFARLEHCYQEDGKWLHKAVATTQAHVTDTVLKQCVIFRPTECLAHWVDCERMVSENCMAGSQQNTFDAGVIIEADGSLAGAPANGTTNCRVKDLYVESNATYGSGVVGVLMSNPNTGEKVQGNVIEGTKVIPVNLVSVAKLETPGTAGNTRQNTIINHDALGGFANSIIIQSNVSYTHIISESHEGDFEDYVSDSGLNTMINNTHSTTPGNGLEPTDGTYGQIVRNASDNSLWVMADDGNRYRINAGDIYAKDTFNLDGHIGAPLAAETGDEWDFTVTGAQMGDHVDVSVGVDCGTIMITANVTAVNTVTVKFFNTHPTNAQSLPNTTYRFVVRRLIA